MGWDLPLHEGHIAGKQKWAFQVMFAVQLEQICERFIVGEKVVNTSGSCSVSCRFLLPLWSVTFTLHAHLDNMEMINDQPLWPCKLPCEAVYVFRGARNGGLLKGCHCLAKVEQALLGLRISHWLGRSHYRLCLIRTMADL